MTSQRGHWPLLIRTLYVSTCVGVGSEMGGGIRKMKAIRWGAYYYSLVLNAQPCKYDMCKSSIRYVHDPVLSSLKMKGIRFYFYNRDEKYLQRGTDWVLKYSSLRFVFKSLISVGSCFLLCMLAIYVLIVSSCVWVRSVMQILRGPCSCYCVVPLSQCAGYLTYCIYVFNILCALS
jgi:hypothetical protein